MQQIYGAGFFTGEGAVVSSDSSSLRFLRTKCEMSLAGPDNTVVKGEVLELALLLGPAPFEQPPSPTLFFRPSNTALEKMRDV